MEKKSDYIHTIIICLRDGFCGIKRNKESDENEKVAIVDLKNQEKKFQYISYTCTYKIIFF